mmetsp:Transcript_43045/g.139675  ORF Transcript_43045/g.139675 Transcript_43045/m.139675 type:complete len:269 (-) Transcript_43045:3239-4045(-)
MRHVVGEGGSGPDLALHVRDRLAALLDLVHQLQLRDGAAGAGAARRREESEQHHVLGLLRVERAAEDLLLHQLLDRLARGRRAAEHVLGDELAHARVGPLCARQARRHRLVEAVGRPALVLRVGRDGPVRAVARAVAPVAEELPPVAELVQHQPERPHVRRRAHDQPAGGGGDRARRAAGDGAPRRKAGSARGGARAVAAVRAGVAAGAAAGRQGRVVVRRGGIGEVLLERRRRRVWLDEALQLQPAGADRAGCGEGDGGQVLGGEEP